MFERKCGVDLSWHRTFSVPNCLVTPLWQEPGTVNLNSTILEVYRVLIKHYKILCIMYKWLDCDALSKKCVLQDKCYSWSCFSFLTLFALFRPPCLLWSMLNTRFIYFLHLNQTYNWFIYNVWSCDTNSVQNGRRTKVWPPLLGFGADENWYLNTQFEKNLWCLN